MPGTSFEGDRAGRPQRTIRVRTMSVIAIGLNWTYGRFWRRKTQSQSLRRAGQADGAMTDYHALFRDLLHAEVRFVLIGVGGAPYPSSFNWRRARRMSH